MTELLVEAPVRGRVAAAEAIEPELGTVDLVSTTPASSTSRRSRTQVEGYRDRDTLPGDIEAREES